MISRSRARLFAWISGAAAILGLLWARPSLHPKEEKAARVSIQPDRVAADGTEAAVLSIDGPKGRGAPSITIAGNPHMATVEDVGRQDGGWQARIRAGVLPGRITVRVEFAGSPAADARLTLTASPRDRYGDGTPDFLRLDDESDQQTFQRWFTWLAEAQYFQAPANRPKEINDCAALIRYAYRETLRAHDTGWAESAQVPVVPAFAAIAKYQYPYTPLGASLFRVRAGPFAAPDLEDGAFRQFADAETLWRFNSHKVGRDPARAHPGDLLFFRHEAGRMPFHSMIYLGESQVRRDGQRYVLYHTGPDQGSAGEIRRLTLEELIRYPQPEWRPVSSNRVFLGVFRWNILRKAFDDDEARHP